MPTAKRVLVGFLLSNALFAAVWLSLTLSAGRVAEEGGASRRLVPQHFEDPQQVPNREFALTMSMIRSVLSLYIGACILLLGSGLHNVVTLVVGLTMAGIWEWWSQVSDVAYVADVPPSVDGFCAVIFYGLMTTYACLCREYVARAVKAILFAMQFIDKILVLLQEPLMDWSGCTGTWLPALSVREQLYDTWVGCTKQDEYYQSIFILKIVQWATIITIGLIAYSRLGTLIDVVSSAMLGSMMLIVALIRLVEDILVLQGGWEEVDEIRTTLMTFQLMMCYALFGVGVCVQLALNTWIWNGCKSEERGSVPIYVRFLTFFRYPAAPLFMLRGILSDWVSPSKSSRVSPSSTDKTDANTATENMRGA